MGAEGPGQRTGPRQAYDGFISYSHAADDLLAPRLQAGLQRFAKPWWKRRALRVFRDESSLSANPHLWSSITDALDTSGWFVLLLSPDAAHSEWVNQEVAYWVEHKDPTKILPVLTDGGFGWADGDITGDAAPDALWGVFEDEPRWVDLRFAKGEEKLDLQDPRFADAVADIASAMRGVPKDELASEEVRQHRRTVRTAWAAGAMLLVLAVAAGWAGLLSAQNAEEARDYAEEASRLAALEEEAAQTAKAEAARALEAESLARSRELAASATAVMDDQPELALLLTLEALDIEASFESISSLHEALLRNRKLWTAPNPTPHWVHINVISPAGDTIVHGSDTELIARTTEGAPLWTHSFPAGFELAQISFSETGDRVGATVFWRDNDSNPAIPSIEGVWLFDARSGEGARLEFDSLCQPTQFVTASDGTVDLENDIAVLRQIPDPATGRPDGCSPWTALSEIAVFDAGGSSLRQTVALPDGAFTFPRGVSRAGDLVAFASPDAGVFVVDLQSGEELLAEEGFAQHLALLSSDGRSLLAGGIRGEPVLLLDVASGTRLREFGGHVGNWIDDATFVGDDRVATTGSGGLIFVRDINTGRELLRLVNESRAINLSADAVGRTLVSATSPGLQVWNVAAHGESGALQLPSGIVSGSLQAAGSTVSASIGVTAGPIPHLVIGDYDTGIAELAYSPADGQDSAMNPSGTLAAVMDEVTRDVQVIDVDTHDVVDVLDRCPDDPCWVTDIEFSPEGDLLAILSIGGTLEVWDMASGSLLFEPDTISSRWQADSLAWHPSEGTLMVNRPDLFARVSTDGTVEPIETELVGGGPMAFSPDGAHLVVAGGGAVWLFDGSSLEQLEVEEFVIAGNATAIDFAPSGVRFAVSDKSGDVSVWSIDGTSLVRDFIVRLGDEAQGVVFLSDDELVAAGLGGAVVGIAVDWEDAAALARNRLTRGFDPQECEHYGIDHCQTLDELREG